MEGAKPAEQSRGRLWIAVGLSLTALALILFGVVIASHSASKSMSLHPSTSVPPSLEPRITIVPRDPNKSLGTPPETQTQIAVPPSLGETQEPITVTAAPDSPVTATLLVPTTVAAPPPSAAQPSSSASGGLTIMTAVATLLVAATGLITAVTGLLKVIRSKPSTKTPAA